MNDLLKRIRAVKWHNCELFARPVSITESLLRWQDENNPLHYNKNHFLALRELSTPDIEAAIAFQKQHNLRGFILKTEEPLSAELVGKFGLYEEQLLLMTQLQNNSDSWKINPNITIRDSQKMDISADLLEACMGLTDDPYHKKWIRKALSESLAVAKAHPEYHWLAAYWNNKLVARCYALEWNGLTQMEDLWVQEDVRRQHIATTLLKHICQQFSSPVFFHTEAADNAQDFYYKLGFETIACCYEYRKEW